MPVLRESEGKPVLIHCSAGIGRTGTFVCTDLGMHDLDNNKVVDVPALMRRVREQRLHSVQTDVSCMHAAGQRTARDCRCSTYSCTRRVKRCCESFVGVKIRLVARRTRRAQ